MAAQRAVVAWTDGHESDFGADELRALVPREVAQPWTAAALALLDVAVPYDAWMGTGSAGAGIGGIDVGLLRGLRLLAMHGLVRVEGVPASEAATEAALLRIGPLMRTIYGPGMWRTEELPASDARNTDAAYSREALAPHTDGAYMREPPGLQAFHCLTPDPGGGGASTLVDGAAIAEVLRRESPRAWRLLSDARRLRVEYAHVVGATAGKLRAERAVFDAAGRIAWNDADRACVLLGRGSGGGASARAALEALSALQHASRKAALVARLALQPGTLLVFDNERLLHGRDAVTGAGRVLTGAYLTRGVWRGRLLALESEEVGERGSV